MKQLTDKPLSNYWTGNCVTQHKVYNGHQIYKDSVGKYLVRFRWGMELGQDVNKFTWLKDVKSFITRVVIPEWDKHLRLENTNYATLELEY